MWHRSGRKLEGFYQFTPYMYGPCSFDLYGELEHLQQTHLVSQAPHSIAQWASYYLTPVGENEASAVQKKADEQTVEFVRSIAREVGSLGFHALLRKVYSEAPDFASRTGPSLGDEPVTLVLAIPSNDGIVFASDGQLTSGEVRASGQKLYKLNDHCAWSASGELALIQRFSNSLEHSLSISPWTSSATGWQMRSSNAS